MYGLSQAKQAKIYAPIGCTFDRRRAETFWSNNHFIDKDGNIIYPTTVANKHGILSVIFPDGSILNWS